jgi:leader peptidase (prepilin peptidase)/N-methyltransferase
MEIFYSLLTAIFWFMMGASIGSFLNVVIYRQEKGESWVKGRSHCDNCNKTIAWYDNIPIFSYLMLKGKSRCCKKPIAKAHLVVEFLFGSLFVWWWFLGFFFFHLSQEPFVIIQPLFWLFIGSICIYILVEDLLSLTISVWSLQILTLLAVIYRFSLTFSGIMQVDDLITALIASGLGASFFWLLHVGFKGRAMGLGDVYLAVPMILLVGWPRATVWFFLAFALGGIVGTVLLLAGKAQLGQKIPFGPFMIISLFLTLIWGEELLAWYLQFLS